MANGKKSFILYCDLIDEIDHLTSEEKGILFQHILEYVNDMNPVLEDRVLLSCWKPIRNKLKRDLKKFDEIKQKRAEAGAKGGKQKVANASKKKQSKANLADSVNDNVNDSDSVSDNEIKEKHRLVLWIEENAPRVQKLTNPITNEQAERIKTEFDKEFIIELFEAMHNYKNLTKNYIDANKTFRSWAKRDGRYDKWLADNGRVKIDMNLG